jgi:hypothetical protein
MFRLLKLAAYALLGYVMYELFMGISQNEPDRMMKMRGRGGGGGGGGGGRAGGGAMSEAAAREQLAGQNVSGPGGGRSVEVGDVSGASRSKRVGRGVVR